MNWTVAQYWMSTFDVCDTWHGVTCSPFPIITTQCDAGESCGICLRAVKRVDCPSHLNTVLDRLPLCSAIDVGEMCEGDGECGTSNEANNCGYDYDVYLRASIPVVYNRVVKVELRATNLEGTLPRHLGLATHMEKLQLYDNSLSGILPTQLGYLNAATVINLASNKLSGTIPPELLASPGWVPTHCGGHQAGYTHQNKEGCPSPSLYINGNNISGTIPTQARAMRLSGHRRPLVASHAFGARRLGCSGRTGNTFTADTPRAFPSGDPRITLSIASIMNGAQSVHAVYATIADATFPEGWSTCTRKTIAYLARFRPSWVDLSLTVLQSSTPLGMYGQTLDRIRPGQPLGSQTISSSCISTTTRFQASSRLN